MKDAVRIDAAARDGEQVAVGNPLAIAMVTGAKIPVGMLAQRLGRLSEE
jgi:hypothetical protein